MKRKTVLLVDDEQGFLEALEDALLHEGYRVLKANTAEAALRILAAEKVDLVTVDIMLPPGPSLELDTTSRNAGIWLCRKLTESYPELDVVCLSVVSDQPTIQLIQSLGVRFLRKGETPLRTVLNMTDSRLKGIAYSTERPPHW